MSALGRRLGFALGHCIDGAVMPWARVLSWLCALSEGQQGEGSCPGHAFASTPCSLRKEQPPLSWKAAPVLAFPAPGCLYHAAKIRLYLTNY